METDISVLVLPHLKIWLLFANTTVFNAILIKNPSLKSLQLSISFTSSWQRSRRLSLSHVKLRPRPLRRPLSQSGERKLWEGDVEIRRGGLENKQKVRAKHNQWQLLPHTSAASVFVGKAQNVLWRAVSVLSWNAAASLLQKNCRGPIH